MCMMTKYHTRKRIFGIWRKTDTHSSCIPRWAVQVMTFELSIDRSQIYVQKAWGSGHSLLGVLCMCNRLTKVIMAHSAVSYIERKKGKSTN